jgi:hypothetical protein
MRSQRYLQEVTNSSPAWQAGVIGVAGIEPTPVGSMR